MGYTQLGLMPRFPSKLATTTISRATAPTLSVTKMNPFANITRPVTSKQKTRMELINGLKDPAPTKTFVETILPPKQSEPDQLILQPPPVPVPVSQEPDQLILKPPATMIRTTKPALPIGRPSVINARGTGFIPSTPAEINIKNVTDYADRPPKKSFGWLSDFAEKYSNGFGSNIRSRESIPGQKIPTTRSGMPVTSAYPNVIPSYADYSNRYRTNWSENSTGLSFDPTASILPGSYDYNIDWETVLDPTKKELEDTSIEEIKDDVQMAGVAPIVMIVLGILILPKLFGGKK